MTLDEISGHLKTIRNLIQDNTENPYASSSSYGSSTKYVFCFTKKPASGSPTDAEFYAKKHRERSLPVIVDLTLVSDPPLSGVSKRHELTVLIRCFASVDTKAVLNGSTREAEELAMLKLDEIRNVFETDADVRASLEADGLILRRGGIGGLRPIDAGGFDFAFGMEMTFWRRTRT